MLLIEDNDDLAFGLRRTLEAEGYAVEVAVDGPAGIRAATTARADLIILDVMLPGVDGFGVLRTVRDRGVDSPVLMLTARGEEADKVYGFRLGADDYVTKPFELRELLARVRSVLRRASEGGRGHHAGTPPPRYGFAGYRLDPKARQLIDPQGATVPLTHGEYELLSLFVEHPNQVLSRDELMTRIHGRDAGPYDRAIDVQIGRLRREIETDPARPTLIKAIRGSGYLFTESVQRE